MERLALIGSELPPNATDAVSRVNGARVATASAFTAILRFGSADHYDVFCLPEQVGPLEHYAAALAGHGIAIERVQLAPPPRLRELLTTSRYLAVHDPTSPHLARLAAMVRPLAPEATPCTCVSYSLSYGNLLPHFLEACTAGLHPTDAVFCCSTDARTALQRLLEHLCTVSGLPPESWRHRLELAPLGIDVEAYAPALPIPAARQRLGWPNEGRFLTYVGRLSPFDKADLDVLLRAFATLVREPGGDDLRLVLAGDDSQRYSGYLRARSQSLGIARVTQIITDMSEATKRLLLWSTDVFVSPADSVQESFGLAVVEAMAAGRPVVVSDWGGYRDLVQDGRTGLLIPTLWGPGTSAVDTQTELGSFMADHLLLGQAVALDEDVLLARLRQLLGNPDLRAGLGERAREQARRYDWPVIVKQYEATWRELKHAALRAGPGPRPAVRLPFWQVFGHYPSHRLQSSDVVELRQQALGRPPAPAPLQLLVPQQAINRVLALLAAGPQPVSALVRGEQDMLGLLWLAKAGSVRIRAAADAERERDSAT